MNVITNNHQEDNSESDYDSEDGRTPLHYVKDVETARALIDAGADVNDKDCDGKTPLCFVENAEIAKLDHVETL